MAVLHRHTYDLSLGRKIALQRQYWRIRGSFVSSFLDLAWQQYSGGERSKALRSLFYAFRASPIHSLLHIYRQRG
jgi:hypothetical protein